MPNPTHDQSTQFPELFNLAEEVRATTRSILEEFNSRHLKLSDLKPHQRIFLFILTRSIKTYASILYLCHAGYGQDVSTLLRSLLENLITANYIIYDKKTADAKSARFVAYKWIIFKRQLPEQQRQIRSATEHEAFLTKKETILQRVNDFKKKFNIASDRSLMTWSGKTVKDMARAVNQNLLNEYETIFRSCSRFSHPTILGDQEYLIQDDQNLIFSPHPSTIGIVPNLKNTIRTMMRLLYIVNSLFDFPFKKALITLDHRCQSIFALPQYSDTPPSQEKTPERKSFPIKEMTITFHT